MAITTKAQLKTALSFKQRVGILRVGTNSASNPLTMFHYGGAPAAGTLAGTSTAAGVVPTDATVGFPDIMAFGAGNTGYLARVMATPFFSGQTERGTLYDMLFKAGAYAFNANVTLAAQPSYASRIPGGDYKGTTIWWESVTAFTGSPSVVVTYTNQDGVAGRTTGVFSLGAQGNIGAIRNLPLQAGDTGVQKIESVIGSVATAGTFNILVLRPLWMGNLAPLEKPVQTSPLMIRLPILFDTSALFVILNYTQNASGTGFGFGLELDIVEG